MLTMLKNLRAKWRKFLSELEAGGQPRAATRVRVEMRVYRAAEDRWYEVPPVESVQ